MHFQYIYIYFQDYYPSPSISDRFYTISSDYYQIFLHFHCIFPACLLHHYSLLLAIVPVSSMFQQIFHPLIWLLSYFPAKFLLYFPSLYLSSIFQWILHDFLWLLLYFPAIPISSSWVFNLFIYLFIYFPRYLSVSFLHHFLWFAAFSIYFSKNFTRFLHFPIIFVLFPLVLIAFSCTFTVFFQHIYCIVIVCS